MISFEKEGQITVDDSIKNDYNSRISQIVSNLTLFDDDLMSLVFDHNIEATNLLLRIILERDDINVIDVVGQRELENPIVDGRNVCLDIFACDDEGKYYDIEVQRSNRGADAHRARFNSSMVDVRMLKKNQKFSDIHDSYVIFITENDKMNQGLPLYHIERIIKENGKSFDDGSHIIYVNGAYQGDDPIGLLMHDFKCKESKDMFYEELRKSVRHYKEEGGQESMCESVENYGNERALATTIELIKNLMDTTGMTMEQAMDALKISEDIRTMIHKIER